MSSHHGYVLTDKAKNALREPEKPIDYVLTDKAYELLAELKKERENDADTALAS